MNLIKFLAQLEVTLSDKRAILQWYGIKQILAGVEVTHS